MRPGTIVKLRGVGPRAALAGMALLVGVLVAPGAAPAGAGPGLPISPLDLVGGSQSGDDDQVNIAIAAGFEGYVAPHRSFPVTITIAADRPVHGALHIDVPGQNGPVTLQRRVDVAADTTETYRFLAPSVVQTGVIETDARLIEDGAGQTASAKAGLLIAPDGEIVGMLPDVAARHPGLPEALPLAVANTGFGRPVPVDPDTLDLGPLALEPLDQMAVQASELAALPEAHRQAITGWVDRGGQLLVVGADPQALAELLPTAWLPPGPAQGARAGLGQVRLVGDDWPTTLLPSPIRSAHEEGPLSAGTIPSSGVGRPLAEQSRASLPAAGGLAFMLMGYVLLIGPALFAVLWFVRRRQLAWVAVPLVALVCTGVAVVGGDSLSTPARSSLVTVYETGPGGTLATTWSILTHPSDGEIGLHLPSGWTAGPMSDDFGMMAFDENGLPIGGPRIEADAVEADTVSTPPRGGWAAVMAQGPAPDVGEALVVTARSEADGVISGTIHNLLDVPLERVVVLAGRLGLADIGTLAANEERDFEITRGTEIEPESVVPELEAWPFSWNTVLNDFGWMTETEVDEDGNTVERNIPLGPDGEPLPEGLLALDDRDADDTLAIPPAWSDLWSVAGWNYRPLGEVVAVGWSDDLGAPIGVRDGTAEVRRSDAAVVTRAQVQPAGDRLTDSAVVRSMVRGPGTESSRLPGGLSQAALAWTDRSGAEQRADAEAGVTLEADESARGDAAAAVAASRAAEQVAAAGGAGPAQPEPPPDPEPVPLPPDAGPATTVPLPGAPGDDSLDPEALPSGAVYAFQLPGSVGGRPVDVQRLALAFPAQFMAAEIWRPGGWEAVTLPAAFERPVTEDDPSTVAPAEVAVPSDSVIGGMVFVRVAIAPGPQQGREFVLYEKEVAG